jgi:hypothetical protein
MTALRSERLQLLNDQRNPAHLTPQARQCRTPPSLRGENLERAIFFQRDEHDAT